MADILATDVARAALVAAAAILQVVLGYWPVFRRGNEERSDEQMTPVTPADFAFIVVWPLIYLACLAFALFQALPAQLAMPLPRAVGWPLLGVLVANSLWVVYVTVRRIDWTSQAIITAGLLLALVALIAIGPDRALGGRDYWLVRAPVELVAGWLNAAAFANLASVLRAKGVTVGTAPAILIIVAATIVAVAVTVALAGWVYAGAFAWALLAIGVANVRAGNRAVAAAAALAIPVLVLAATAPLSP